MEQWIDVGFGRYCNVFTRPKQTAVGYTYSGGVIFCVVDIFEHRPDDRSARHWNVMLRR